MISLTMQSKKTMFAVSATLLLSAAAFALPPVLCNTGYQPGTGACGALWGPTFNTYNGAPITAGNPVKRDAWWQLSTALSVPSNPGTAAQKALIQDPCTAGGFVPAWEDDPDGELPLLPVFGFWSVNGPTSNWITPQIENKQGGLYIYRTTYRPAVNAVAPVIGRLQSDNETYSIYGTSPAMPGVCQHLAGNSYNGIAFAGPTVNGPSGFLAWTWFATTPFSVTGGQPASLYFVVRNRGVHGLDANPTPTGLRVEFVAFPQIALGQGSGGDFNGDGQTDMAVVDNGNNKVAVYLNTNGQFPKATEYSVGKNPAFVAVGDLNGDGTSDLAVANVGSGTVSVLLNLKGKFGKALNYPAGTNPSAIAIGDVNGDGIPDLVVANASTGSISILRGTGGGKFSAPQSISVGDPIESSPSSIAVADLNGDGIPDLVLTDAGNGMVSVMLGLGGGSFQAPVSYSSNAVAPGTVSVADLNGDGVQDLTFSDGATGSVYIMLGNSAGTFNSALSYPAGSNPQALTVIKPPTISSLSVAVADPSSNMLTVLPVNSDGSLGSGQSYAAGTTPWSMVPFASSTGTDLGVVDSATNTITTVTVK